MDSRYEHPEIARLWSPRNQYQRWYWVERCVAEAQADAGLIPREAFEAINAAESPIPECVKLWEQTTRHDVAAYLGALGERIDPPEHRRWLHFGLTSSDLVDTANARLLDRVRTLTADLADQLGLVLMKQAVSHEHTYRMGRTHGQLADPLTFGLQSHRFYAQLQHAIRDLNNATVPMKLSGPVGTYAYNPPEVERAVAADLGLTVDSFASQVVGRHHYVRFAFALVELVDVCAAVATEIRLGAQSEVGELFEGFGAGQIGSSAMPTKRNPIRSERLCGLTRVAHSHLSALLSTYSGMWGERDISNSSVERTALRDLTCLVAWMLDETRALVGGLVVDVATMGFRVQDNLPSPAARLYEAVRGGADRSETHEAISQGRDDGFKEAFDAGAHQPGWYVRNHPLAGRVASVSSAEVDS